MRPAALEERLIKTPWDMRALGVETFELKNADEETLRLVTSASGHYTLRVDPLSSKKSLHEHGFYYCDTLVRPVCSKKRFVFHANDKVSVSLRTPLDALSAMVPDSFRHDRFHRDWNVRPERADARYLAWLRDLHAQNSVFAILYEGRPAGFAGFSENKILLQVVAEAYRGKGLAKAFLAAVCRERFSAGCDPLMSSVSLVNSAALNIYSALGFRFEDPVDIYHRFVP